MFSIAIGKRIQYLVVMAALVIVAGCAQQTVKADESVGTAPAMMKKGGGGRGKMGRSEGSMTEAERSRLRARFKQSLSNFEDTLVHFDFDKSEIRPDQRPILDRKARFLLAYTSVRIQIEGHADERGTVEYNIALGHRRSQSAKDYLVSLGVAASRIDTVSYGEERPLDPGHNEVAWAKNRRAKFNVIGGIPAGLN